MRLPLNTLIIGLVSLLVLTACDRSRPPEVEPGARVTDAGLEELERGARGLRLTGDLDAMLERGYIRILVPYSKTFFFYEGAKPRGLAYEFMEAFAKTLRKSHGATPGGLTLLYLPTRREQLIPGIAEGLGDIAIAGLTATDDRKHLVDFVTHASNPVAEVVVTGPDAPRLESLEDLSGQRVLVRKSSSYYESLQELNARLRSSGKGAVKIVEADENLEDEDILELVRSGAAKITVIDNYLARFWADVMGDLAVREDLLVREEGLQGPVVRKDSPQLVAALTAFQKTHGLGTEFGNVVTKRYLQDNPWVRNPNASADRQRFDKAIPIFRKYGSQYDFDVLLLVAQGYQESQLDQATRSRSGAVGVMQIKPATAAGEPVNIVDVKSKMENNIHAGVKYLRHLVDDYFGDPAITALNRHLFAIAAYNAGPTRIQALRRKAEAQGLDPNVWFNNVELVSARNIGPENVQYVRNILKYWVAYRLAADFQETTE
ncbi:MAG: transporter substrate-binding domain-containing protein [Gammaproteobacteria bacterium]|nr:transporter substrate-binding domain-containing protein [Gammaproteobacteria bacterium]MDH5171750.1 transporter substrate-binding domain-containing protein [Gammaproteobacteria bacterium]